MWWAWSVSPALATPGSGDCCKQQLEYAQVRTYVCTQCITHTHTHTHPHTHTHTRTNNQTNTRTHHHSHLFKMTAQRTKLHIIYMFISNCCTLSNSRGKFYRFGTDIMHFLFYALLVEQEVHKVSTKSIKFTSQIRQCAVVRNEPCVCITSCLCISTLA